jgi:ABC-type branched-subunit amino acid transport system substrate-binding protein
LISAFTLVSCAGVRIPGVTPRPQPTPPPIAQPAAPAPPAAPAQPVKPAAPALLAPEIPAGAAAGPLRIGLLLPLSGTSSALGNAMLESAEMALFDVPDSGLQLLPRDTGGAAKPAAAAASDVIAQGARIIIGPLLAAEVGAVKPLAAAAKIPVLAFSNATQFAGDGTWLLGFQPRQEVMRVVQYARAKGYQRFAAIAPSTPYGDIALAALQDAVAGSNASVVRVARYDPATADLSPIVQSFAQNTDYDALLIPEGGYRLRTLAPLLPYNDIDPDTIKFLGTGLWDVPGLGTEPALAGGWYAAPAPQNRARFEQRYRELFHQAPPRLATLSYDATALVATLAQRGDLSPAALVNPNGFSGLDGIFRLMPDGITQRGLAVLEVRRGEPGVVDPAPTDFQSLGQ